MTGDSALVARARQGDEAAFDGLYRRHRDQMYTLCLNLCGDREQAKDLLQETFVRAWRGLPKFRGQSSFATWLHRIAVNICRDAARKRRPLTSATAAAASPASDPDVTTVEQVRATLSRLRAPHRMALVLRYNLSLSYQEIADLLNWSLPKVKVTLHRARAAFKTAYCEVDGIEQ
jgi:RNA polymerase sigma-70 factor (ECF subfamily)